MATFRGIAAVGTGVLAALDVAWTREPFVADTLSTGLVRAEDLASRPFEFGLTAFVYRVAVNGTQRTAASPTPGRRRPLPVEANLIVTAWGPSPQRELELLGWAMRVLDDEPVLAAPLLNRDIPDTFGREEFVEVVPDPISLEACQRLWDTLPWHYQLSAAYTARVIRLEATRTLTAAGPVLERDFAMATHPGGST